MPKSIALPKNREDGLTRLDTLIKNATERGPIPVTIRLTNNSAITGHIHHMDRYTILFVDAEDGDCMVIHKHAVMWIQFPDPISVGLAELAAEKSAAKK